jgi:hypothetical protein
MVDNSQSAVSGGAHGHNNSSEGKTNQVRYSHYNFSERNAPIR